MSITVRICIPYTLNSDGELSRGPVEVLSSAGDVRKNIANLDERIIKIIETVEAAEISLNCRGQRCAKVIDMPIEYAEF